ncbi:hypothetical protein [Sphingopyxis sp. KK2]|uniref:hypothetical protein n=1 Tax=Sphingopyxis sp. KK2 TaxID=1855727 RepID=UPI001181BBB7|nr:hypothetical protein [Sphingopyxis sp. KK2]
MAIALPVFASLVGGLWLVSARHQADLKAAPTVLDLKSARTARAVLDCLREDATGHLPLRRTTRVPDWMDDDRMARYRLYNPVWSIEVMVLPDQPTRIVVRRPKGELAPRHRAAILHCR